jgi:hypothetical protein
VGDVQQAVAGARHDSPTKVASSGVNAERDHVLQP